MYPRIREGKRDLFVGHHLCLPILSASNISICRPVALSPEGVVVVVVTSQITVNSRAKIVSSIPDKIRGGGSGFRSSGKHENVSSKLNSTIIGGHEL